MKRYQLFINGAWINPICNSWFETVNPFTGKVWAEIARSSSDDANAAVVAAHEALT